MQAFVIALLLLPGLVFAGVVEDWNEAFVKAVMKETPPPCLTSRNLPILHLSILRAVEAVAAKGGTQEQIDQAAHVAAAESFKVFFPAQKNVEWVPPKGGVSKFVHELAIRAAKQTLAGRENDGSSTTVHYFPNEKPGQWRRTPPNFRPPELPHWGLMKPFVIKDVSSFRPPPPPALDSDAYAAELEEVRIWGAKEGSRRSEEETMIARFWSDFSYTTSPAGHWNDIARTMSLQKKLPTRDAARLFAQLNTATADACIAIWNTKYHYNFWRPVTAIRRADEDRNEATSPIKNWEPLLVSPPHPDYVSGHSGISGAAAAVLQQWFGEAPVSFEVDSDTVRNVKRRFTSFTTCAEEVSRSRVLGGIHFPAACKQGLELGQKVAAEVMGRFDKVYLSPTS